jgi:F420-non-reducing hydrogenase large subunit
MSEEERDRFKATAEYAVEFAQFALQIFDDVVLKNEAYVDVVLSEAYAHRTYYMGQVDDENKVNFYDGDIRVVDPDGVEVAKFAPQAYVDHIREHIEPWSYISFPYLRDVGWKGFVDGTDSGVYRVAPIARLNVSDGMATPLAQEAYERMYGILGGKPVHATLAIHWARLIEALYAAERMVELLEDPEITSEHIRNVPTEVPEEGVGIVEAPRGTLIHHYQTDERGLLTGVSLIVATNHNAAPIAMSVEKAAKGLIHGGEVSDGLLNMVEMAFRAYDPCHACATHAMGETPMLLEIRSADGELVKQIVRG